MDWEGVIFLKLRLIELESNKFTNVSSFLYLMYCLFIVEKMQQLVAFFDKRHWSNMKSIVGHSQLK
jgi:hypothetical protein